MRYYWEVRDLEPWAMAWLGTTAPVYVLKYTEGFKNDTHKYLSFIEINRDMSDHFEGYEKI
jgi:hypothetical protein